MAPQAPNAQLRLCGLDLPIVWPPGAPVGVLVWLGAGAPAHAELVVVIAPPEHGTAVLGWAVDHATELGAGPALHLGGAGATELAAQARADGWPEIVLVR